jgi:hypothetical protein
MLSLDLGQKNLGWVYLDWDTQMLDFGLFIIDDAKSKDDEFIIHHRCLKIQELIKGLKDRFKIDVVIIERQVKNNRVCQLISYAIVAFCVEYNYKVFIFSPLNKFKVIDQPYTTVKKAHKKLSIENCWKTLQVYFPNKLKEFLKNKKKDDIADAFNQMWIYGILNNIIGVSFEEYREIVVEKV